MTKWSLRDITYQMGIFKQYKLGKHWTAMAGMLHHDTCPAINGREIKGSWNLDHMKVCFQCGEVIPPAVKLLFQRYKFKGKEK